MSWDRFPAIKGVSDDRPRIGAQIAAVNRLLEERKCARHHCAEYALFVLMVATSDDALISFEVPQSELTEESMLPVALCPLCLISALMMFRGVRNG